MILILTLENFAEDPITSPTCFLFFCLHKYTNIQIHKYTTTQIHKYKNTQIHKYTNIQIHKYKKDEDNFDLILTLEEFPKYWIKSPTFELLPCESALSLKR